MHKYCKCGGKIVSIDSLIPQPVEGKDYLVYSTVRLIEGVASFQCNRCNTVYRQGLRVSKKKLGH